jgi:hypothetical protein
MSLNETMIPWRGHLKFRTYNPGKITKYRMLVRMVCETVSSYTCKKKIYAGEEQTLEDAVLLLFDRNLGHNHHTYKDTFYKSVSLAETLLGRKAIVGGTTKANKAHSP